MHEGYAARGAVLAGGVGHGVGTLASSAARGCDGGLLPVAGAGGQMVLEGVHVWWHGADLLEHVAQPERDGEGEDVETAGANNGVVRGGDEGVHQLLVGESGRPGRGVLVDGVCAECVDGEDDEVSDAGENVVGG